MPTIWEPPNRHALPTPSEIVLVEESIKLLETQLQSAMVGPIGAAELIATLQRQIEERRAWIAPIRRLPHDVLSIIFLDVCEEGEWWTPLDLAEVCQVWRRSMMATPRAWSHLSLRDILSPEIHSLYFARSAPCPLHIVLPAQMGPRMMSSIGGITDRIQCLNLRSWQLLTLEGYPFPRLERLHISGNREDADEVTNTGFMLDANLFPKLRSLGAHKLLDTIPWRTPPFANFVPLQELRVIPSNPLMWVMIVEHCCETLMSLYVNLSYIEGYTPGRKPIMICFPRLYHLEIYNSSSIVPWSIDARTPSLQTYNESTPRMGYAGPIHKDTSTAVVLRFLGSMDLSRFPCVRQMEPAPWTLRDTVARLRDDPRTCPDLELIVDTKIIKEEELVRAKEMIASRNAVTRRTIRFGPRMQDGVFAYPGIESHVGSLNSSVNWV